ncbi:ATP-dependent zinc metalloprotease FTSH 12-chloroplastic [Striga hermonthica]|uniref:ATP-dependent zinc metalloprotease FTSH 12-chloroplastic n=1 Tax=Striga hermonthica TaxID=68872 RepID=A0A9N7P0M8_STRHE|nr:ATP-dependent zinc metalloprotease FTSH 12-chloroplastic [Striga hermonthica]
MEVATLQCRPTPLQFSPENLFLRRRTNRHCLSYLSYRPALSRRKRSIISASSSSSSGPQGFSWPHLLQSIRRGSQRFLENLGKSAERVTGINLEDIKARVDDISSNARESARQAKDELEQVNLEMMPQFVSWNKWERWKDIANWEPKRLGVLVLYVFVIFFSCRSAYKAIRAPVIERERRELTDAYMEALIPEPTPTNVRRFKQGMWRKATPKGLKLKKLVEGPDGTLLHDSSFVGENAWEDDAEKAQKGIKELVEQEIDLNKEDKNVPGDLGLSVENQVPGGAWRDRLAAWKEIIQKEKITAQLDSLNAKYVVEFDMKEVENSLRKDVVEEAKNAHGTRALWISKRWWRYRPKLPYTYFLQKLDSSEVDAVVFTEDLKRLYVTMKEGFPLEYIVDIPLDPFLFEAITGSGVEVDLLQKRQIHYFLKVVLALLPGLLILCFIQESVMLLRVTTSRLLYKKHNQLLDMVHAENFILPANEIGDIKSSMYKDVVLGGDVWDLLDELMMYLGNPMQYYEKDVKFVRGVLFAGPPGTGKTLFARTLANKSGLPFVFASGADFTDTEKSGAAKINNLFAVARRNAPAFVFIDEIDAIAGRYAKKDQQRRATFEALIDQLDGERGKIGVDRFSLAQAVIFLCATNRPEVLHPEFVLPGRIDRRVYIGLPDAKQRVQIFGVHSAGKELAEDVDFEKVVFRTVGYSGADIRNLINEAGIMAVRKGHSKIHQQDFVGVLDKQLLEGMGVLLTEEEQLKCIQKVSIEKKWLLAVHEAGHIVLAHLFPRFDWHAFSQLLPGGKETAMSVFYPREDMVNRGYTTFGYMQMQMVVAHGGRCAERLVFDDDITDGGLDDLKKITKIAREMVISPNNHRLGLAFLTKRHGLMNRKENSGTEIMRYRWDDPRVVPVDMSLELSELFTRELTRYIDETEALAMKGLRENKHILEEIARILLEKSRITGQEVDDIIKGLSPILFEDFLEPFRFGVEEGEPMPHNDRLKWSTLDLYPAPMHRC